MIEIILLIAVVIGIIILVYQNVKKNKTAINDGKEIETLSTINLGIDDLKTIVGELQKASEAHKRQSKSIDAHVKFMGEETEIDEGKMSQIATSIDDIANAMKKDRNMKPFIDKFKKDARKTLDPKKSLEKILPDYIPGKDVEKLKKMAEQIDERMKTPRQLINPNKEVMIVKKNKVIVIDKKDKDKYMRQGWELAEKKDITSKELLDNKYKEEKNGAQHFSKVNEDNYVWNFVYDDFGRTKLTTEPDKATHLVYTMEGKDNPQLLKLSEREILDYKKGENK